MIKGNNSTNNAIIPTDSLVTTPAVSLNAINENLKSSSVAKVAQPVQPAKENPVRLVTEETTQPAPTKTIEEKQDETPKEWNIKGQSYEKQKNYAEAIKYYQKAAEQEDAEGQYGLGRIYYLGLSVEIDFTEAAKWYRKAAEQGMKMASWHLGVIYEEGGYGIEKDLSEARKWYQKAIDQGLWGAKADLERLEQ